ncbi:hypothetical protein SHIRM173S_07890 [Streptomyces hirsutus]
MGKSAGSTALASTWSAVQPDQLEVSIPSLVRARTRRWVPSGSAEAVGTCVVATVSGVNFAVFPVQVYVVSANPGSG